MINKFYKLPQDVAARKDLRASGKVVFSILLDFQGGNEKSWPSIQTLMSKSGLSRQTVLDSITILKKAGLLKVIRRGNGKSNHYKCSLETRPVQKLDQSKKHTTGSLETRLEAVQKLDPNQTDLLNQTYILFSFVLQTGKTWDLSQTKFDEYKKTYPELDIENEFRKAAQWLIDNPAKRKTAKGMPRFLNGWLSRIEQNEQKRRKTNSVSKQSNAMRSGFAQQTSSVGITI